MTLSLSLFLYIYIFFLFVWSTFSFVALFHIFKYGFKNFISYFSVVVYLGISALIIGISFFYILQVDWSQKIIDVSGGQNNTQQLW